MNIQKVVTHQMDFTSCTHGWKPYTSNEKYKKEQDKREKRELKKHVPTSFEKRWKIIISIAEEHGKKIHHL
jgi:hypothetical protein